MSSSMRVTLAYATLKTNIIAFFMLAAVVLISLFESASPLGNVRSFENFTIFFSVWFIGMATLASWQMAIMSWCRDSRVPYLMLAACALMVARVWTSAQYFTEIWVMVGICVVMAATFSRMGSVWPVGMERTMAEQGSNGKAQNQSQVLEVKKASIAFKDVAGMEEVKGRLKDAGLEVMNAHRKGVKARNGILLTGKPGNGKTYMAEALAGELNLPFLTMTVGDVTSKWVGDTTERVVQGFRDARANAPCVLFLDEVDSLLSNRETASSNDESAKTTNALLTELVNIRSSGVVVMAASNFVNKLDPAAIREGRFDFKIEITPPDAKARYYLIKSRSKRTINHETIETAVRRWDGFSVARITAVMDEINQMPAGNLPISYNQMKVALRTVQGRAGTIPESTPVIDDLVMADEHKSALRALAARMDRVEEIEAMGGSVPRGVLFYGPAGTGKTLTARALAKTAKWAFLSVSGMDLMTKPDRIDSLIEEASNLRPCVVFIDEADDVFGDRRMSQNAALTNKLLAVLDGSGGHIPDVLFIAATNHPDSMDAAALRGGRFTEKIEFGLPDEATIEVFLARWGSETAATVADELDYGEVARLMIGNPIANIKEIMQLAVNNAIMRLRPGDEFATVEMIDIHKAISSIGG